MRCADDRARVHGLSAAEHRVIDSAVPPQENKENIQPEYGRKEEKRARHSHTALVDAHEKNGHNRAVTAAVVAGHKRAPLISLAGAERRGESGKAVRRRIEDIRRTCGCERARTFAVRVPNLVVSRLV